MPSSGNVPAEDDPALASRTGAPIDAPADRHALDSDVDPALSEGAESDAAGEQAPADRATVVEPAQTRPKTSRARYAVRLLLSLSLLALSGVVVYILPRLTGSTWTDIAGRIAQIGLGTGIAIAVLWIVGLAFYTIAMTSSMPGLNHRRAMALNLAGSSAANLLPFGGVIGAGLNVAMVKSWRLSVRNFASSTAVLNVVNLVTKLSLPIIAGVVLSNQGAAAPWLGRSAKIGSIIAAAFVVTVVWALISRSWAMRMDAILGGLAHRMGRGHRVLGPTADGASGPITALQTQVREVFRFRWLGLTTGMTGYVLLQWALFALCLHATGVGANPAAVFAAFAVERALTLAVVTPAGTGLAEAAATGLLVALGFSPAASAAGVLLYRLFVYLAEIPVGAVVLGAWAAERLARRGRPNGRRVRGDSGSEVVSSSPSETIANPPTPSKR